MAVVIIKKASTPQPPECNQLQSHPLYSKIMEHMRALPSAKSESWLRGASRVAPDSPMSRFITQALRSSQS